MNIIKKTYSKNNNEIILIEGNGGIVIPPYNTVLIIGVVHGDEPQGKFLIENYLNGLKEDTSHFSPLTSHLKNRLLFIPCLNPDGLQNKTRTNANGVDLNRNFPTKNWGVNGEEKFDDSEFFGGVAPSSEIETRFIVEILEEFSPDVILTLHAPYKVVNYDGPAKEIAQKISQIINYPAQEDIGYSTPGSFGTYAGVERNIPTITLELDENIHVAELIRPVNNIFDFLSSY